jgi:hypothetical protein
LTGLSPLHAVGAGLKQHCADPILEVLTELIPRARKADFAEQIITCQHLDAQLTGALGKPVVPRDQLSSAVVVRSWSVDSPDSRGALLIADARRRGYQFCLASCFDDSSRSDLRRAFAVVLDDLANAS